MSKEIWEDIKDRFEELLGMSQAIAQGEDCEQLGNVCARAGKHLYTAINSGGLDENPLDIPIHFTFKSNPSSQDLECDAEKDDLIINRYRVYWACFLASLDKRGKYIVRNSRLCSFGKPLSLTFADEHDVRGNFQPDWGLVDWCPEDYEFPCELNFIQTVCEVSIWLCEKLSATLEAQQSPECVEQSQEHKKHGKVGLYNAIQKVLDEPGTDKEHITSSEMAKKVGSTPSSVRQCKAWKNRKK